MLEKNKLEKFNQQHLYEYEKLMSSNEKHALEDKLESLDLEEIQEMYKNLYVNRQTIDDTSDVSEVKYTVKSELDEQVKDEYRNQGIEAIRNGQFAVVLMAGGQGTRLGIQVQKDHLK